MNFRVKTAEDFIKHLASLQYDGSKLDYRFGKDRSQGMLDAFIIKENKEKIPTDNILLDLVLNYKTALQLISPIGIWEEYVETDLFIKFGENSDSDLAIWKGTNEIFDIQTYDEMEIRYFAAINANAFLEAFLINGIYSLDKEFKDKEARHAFYTERAIRAAEAAGGRKYLPFWLAVMPTE